MYSRHIAISGEPGTGKTSVSRLLASAYGLKVVSTGEIHRSYAASLGISTLEANHRAEQDPVIDQRIDETIIALGRKDVPRVFDSRLAWHFVPSAFKIHLLVDHSVAAQRLLKVRTSAVESYSVIEEARRAVGERYRSERRRFLSAYGVDISSLRNYDLVIDASDASVPAIVAEIRSILDGYGVGPKNLRISPRRVLPTGDAIREIAWRPVQNDNRPTWEYPIVGYARPFLFVLRGHIALSEGIRSGSALLPAFLEVEGDEEVIPGLTAEKYLRSEAQVSWIYDWEDAHSFRFGEYPRLG